MRGTTERSHKKEPKILELSNVKDKMTIERSDMGDWSLLGLLSWVMDLVSKAGDSEGVELARDETLLTVGNKLCMHNLGVQAGLSNQLKFHFVLEK